MTVFFTLMTKITQTLSNNQNVRCYRLHWDMWPLPAFSLFTFSLSWFLSQRLWESSQWQNGIKRGESFLVAPKKKCLKSWVKTKMWNRWLSDPVSGSLCCFSSIPGRAGEDGYSLAGTDKGCEKSVWKTRHTAIKERCLPTFEVGLALSFLGQQRVWWRRMIAILPGIWKDVSCFQER